MEGTNEKGKAAGLPFLGSTQARVYSAAATFGATPT
jgi:hypothetical protein